MTTLEGIDENEMRAVIALSQCILGLSIGHPAGRLFNALMLLQSRLMDNNHEFAHGCVEPLRSLLSQAENVGTPPAPPAEAQLSPTLH